ncbi:(Fe-S)-binding protein [Phaeodactylibacter luteus]|uniref:(Fe-S)-binding protein n=1 Tax=Phaeodactylibacter luteus TaxID=1564516 RepID=A0A5C6RGZ5_9BACT|nr:(Fe-S)-binding protein [Phaeodactylibacter luteus]TXB60583.1 (Fe-S)-binding protein [Phaeodactylibacter luteus]
MIQQLAFAVLTIGAGALAWRSFSRVRRNIFLGQDEDISGDNSQRWRNVLLVAFGQQKMFKRMVPALLHLTIYLAFVITQVELIEILIDGFSGQHRFFADKLGGFYTFVISFIEVLSLLTFFATFIFLARRNLLRIPRFTKPEMNGWPKLDGNLILVFEIILLIGIFTMNGTDVVLQQLDPEHFKDTGALAVSSWLGPALFGGLSEGTLLVLERSGWWLHFGMVLLFLNYLPYSKHLHIILAFPNTFYARLKPRGEMDNMDEITKEVRSMMDPEAAFAEEEVSEEMPEFGANDVFSLSWKNIMDAYSCTECGRCTSVCPANITGKKLSPRKVLMDIRDRAEEVGRNLDSGDAQFAKDEGQPLSKGNYDDGKSLFDYISSEELHACTTCNACVEACPVLINPLEPILKMRRYEILTLSQGPQDWLPMFNSLENSGSAWSIPDARDKWAQDALRQQ